MFCRMSKRKRRGGGAAEDKAGGAGKKGAQQGPAAVKPSQSGVNTARGPVEAGKPAGTETQPGETTDRTGSSTDTDAKYVTRST